MSQNQSVQFFLNLQVAFDTHVKQLQHALLLNDESFEEFIAPIRYHTKWHDPNTLPTYDDGLRAYLDSFNYMLGAIECHRYKFNHNDDIVIHLCQDLKTSIKFFKKHRKDYPFEQENQIYYKYGYTNLQKF